MAEREQPEATDSGEATDTGDTDDNVVAFPSRSDRSDQPPVDDRPLREVIGEILREERLDQERSLADVADEAAVSLPYLSEVERGRKDVSSALLESIVRSLGLEMPDVLERTADRLRVGSKRCGPQALLLAA